MERRVERAVLHLEHVLGLALDRVGDRVAVGRPDAQRLQNQQVERPLEHFALNRLISAFRHGWTMILH